MSFSRKNIIHITLLFILLLIPNLCALVMAIDLEGSLIMKIGYLGMVMVGLLLPALILKIRTYFIFEGFLSFLFMPIDIASLYLNKQSASKLFLNSILNTDVLEAFELLHTMWPICLAVFLVWGIYIYRCITIPNLPLFNSKLRYWGVLAIITTTMAIYGGQTLLIRKINPTFTFQEVMSQSTEKFGLKFLKIYPYNLYINTHLLWQDNKAWNEAQEDLSTFSFGINKRDSIDNTLYLLYIGEATRYDHLSINGYERNTTPHLLKENNIISFTSIYTQANLTNYSIPYMLTRASVSNSDILHKEKSLLEAFQEAGYHSAYISNSSYFPFTMRIMHNCDYHYIFNRGMDAVNNYDINLVNKAIEHYNSNGQIILLHSLGSHFKYSIRYPADFSYFLPASKPTDGYDILKEENKSLLINSYDNSIRYTDYVLHELISWMDALDNAAVLIYISDHGESFWDDERKLSLHGSYELSEAEYHVPCFIWYSNEFQQQHPQKINTLEQNKHITQNSSTIFHTLLHLADIVEIVDSTKSLCSTYVQPLDTFQVLSGAGEIKTYVIQ